MGWNKMGSFRLAVSVATVASMAMHCGIVDQKEFTGARIPTGTAPYQDLGPVTMCIGPHRIGSPDTELSGFCVPVGTGDAAQVCNRDDQCRAREMCVCGLCMVKFCTRNDECGPGSRCDFTASRCVTTCDDVCDCSGPNARCDIGMCQQMCLVNAECQTGEICSLSRARCLTVPCESDADCFDDPPEECLIQREPRYVSKPTVLPEGNILTVWADMDVLGQRMIFAGRTDSPQKIDFQARAVLPNPLEPCVQDDYCNEYYSPTVIRAPAGYVMFYVRSRFFFDSSQPPACGNGICELGESQVGGCPQECPTDGIMRATSADGANWTLNPPAPVLVPYYLWERGRLSAPAAVINPSNGLLRLFYEAGDGDAIGMVQSQDPSGAVFGLPDMFDAPDVTCGVRCRVLTPAQVATDILWRDVRRVRTPYVLLEEDFDGNPYYRLWFAAWGFESPTATSFGTVEQIPGNYSIGYAASPDGENFEVWPFNPVFDRIKPNTFVNHTSELDPLVLRWNDKYYLFYSGADREGRLWENLGVAVNPPSATGQ